MMDATDAADARIPAMPVPGRVILLNGPSSAGKTGIARELLGLLDGSWFHMSVDAFHAMRGDRPIADEDLQPEIDRTALGFHRAVAGMAAAGNNLVVDYLLTRRWRMLDLAGLLTPVATLLVAVRCPLPELRRRAAERADRDPGLAEAQYHQVFAHGPHDIDLDTSTHTARACAERIRAALTTPPRPTAFETFRRLHGT